MWQLGNINVSSTTTGSLYLGNQTVKKVYQGQLQVYPDFVPFPSSSVFDWWHSSNIGSINGRTLYNSGGSPAAVGVDNDGQFNYLGWQNITLTPDASAGNGAWQSTQGNYMIAVGRLKNPNEYLDGINFYWYQTTGTYHQRFGFTKEKYETPGTPTDSRYYYSAPTTVVYSPTGSLPSTIGFAMNVLDNGMGGSNGYREIYMNSSTPLYSQTPYSYNLGFPYSSPYVVAYNRTFITEVIILTSRPSIAELDEYRQYVSAKYNITA